MAEHSEPNPFSKALVAIKAAMSSALAWRTLVIWIACSVLATYSGPFGTYLQASSLEMLATWLLLIGSAIVTAYVLFELCEVFLAPISANMRQLIFFTLGAISIGFMLDTILIAVFDYGEPEKPTRSRLILYAFAVMCFVQIVRKVLLRGDDESVFGADATARQVNPDQPAPYSRLAQRLEIPEGARINHITADGHFIEVATCAQKFRARMRFSDAVAELDDAEGLMVHRSHWISRDAIRGWVPDSKKPFVMLENDTRVPVSKTNFDKVSRAGLPELQDQA